MGPSRTNNLNLKIPSIASTDFNLTHAHLKKGVSLMPITFGISFTNTPMNHARALVHIYQDGSVGVSTGAVEMGQSVNTKMLQVAAAAFGIGLNQVKIETTNTTRVANTVAYSRQRHSRLKW
jgi:xanthine dehydrogenase large subunit